MAAQAEEKVEDKKQTVILVTGANKGIGLELCKQLVQLEDVHVLLGCRNFAYVPKPKDTESKKDPDNWEVTDEPSKTRIEILRDVRFKDVKNIDFVEIDISEKESCTKAAAAVKDKYQKIDVLVNNAGMAFKGDAFDIDVVNTTLKTNYYGTINATAAFMPLLNDGGRIVMTSSMAGILDHTIEKDAIEEVQKTLLDPKLTMEGIEKFLTGFRDAVTKDKSLKDAPYKAKGYGMSKTAMSAYSRVLAQSVAERGIFVAAYCPGWCQTYMSSGGGKRSSANGAKGLQLLCSEKMDVKDSGKFWGVQFADKGDEKYYDNDTGKLVNYDWIKGHANMWQ